MHWEYVILLSNIQEISDICIVDMSNKINAC